jgi:hypothetical protein
MAKVRDEAERRSGEAEERAPFPPKRLKPAPAKAKKRRRREIYQRCI